MRLLYPVEPQPFDISETPLEPLAPYCEVIELCWQAYGTEASHQAAQALTLSVLCMAVPTFLIGVLPDHMQIGVAASVFLANRANTSLTPVRR